MKKQSKQSLLLVICIITIILFLSNIAYANTDTFTVTIKPSGLLLYNESPIDGATGVSTTPTLNISCLSLTNNTMNLSWYWKNETDTWVLFGENLSVNNGTYLQVNSNFSLQLTTYYWMVNLSDNTSMWVDSEFYFTTEDVSAPPPSVGDFIIVHHNSLWVFIPFMALIPLALFLGKKRRRRS